MNSMKEWIASHTNASGVHGSLRDCLVGADVFIGVSAPGVVTVDDIRRMAPHPIVFALANPDPEISPEDVADVVSVIATGRSDYPNQINNVLAFPGIFRGALDASATTINEEMKVAAAYAIAGTVADEELSADYIIPSAFNRRVVEAVATAVAEAATKSRVTRRRA